MFVLRIANMVTRGERNLVSVVPCVGASGPFFDQYADGTFHGLLRNVPVRRNDVEDRRVDQYNALSSPVSNDGREEAPARVSSLSFLFLAGKDSAWPIIGSRANFFHFQVRLRRIPCPIQLVSVRRRVTLPPKRVFYLWDYFTFLRVGRVERRLFPLTACKGEGLVLFFRLLRVR